MSFKTLWFIWKDLFDHSPWEKGEILFQKGNKLEVLNPNS